MRIISSRVRPEQIAVHELISAFNDWLGALSIEEIVTNHSLMQRAEGVKSDMSRVSFT